jgi:hypothetical protein
VNICVKRAGLLGNKKHIDADGRNETNLHVFAEAKKKHLCVRFENYPSNFCSAEKLLKHLTIQRNTPTWPMKREIDERFF